MVTLHEDKAFVGFLGSSECGFNSKLIGRWLEYKKSHMEHGTKGLKCLLQHPQTISISTY
jgi:hypothetical protein